jgi:putative molybdopterin biosynthesis protein
MDGIAVRSRTTGASETTPLWLCRDEYDVVDTGDPMPDGRDAVVMRDTSTMTAAGRRRCAPPLRRISTSGRSAGRERG